VKKSILSYIFVFVQFFCIVFFSFSYSFSRPLWTLFPKIFALLLVLWSIAIMNNSVLSVFPNPAKNTVIVKIGPYKYIRHPMYLSLFLFFVPYCFEMKDLAGFLIMGLFIINQLTKMIYEEKLLQKNFPEYSSYMKHSWRLIPFIF
jgi:protein-S-isoprenylcysteine O-methyltransferase Ste14